MTALNSATRAEQYFNTVIEMDYQQQILKHFSKTVKTEFNIMHTWFLHNMVSTNYCQTITQNGWNKLINTVSVTGIMHGER